MTSKVALGYESQKPKLKQRLSKVLSRRALFDYWKLSKQVQENDDKIPFQRSISKERKVYMVTLGINDWRCNLDFSQNYIDAILQKENEFEEIKIATYTPSKIKLENISNIPAISCVNEDKDVVNKNAIAFPKDINEIKPIEKTHGEELKEKLQNLGRKEQSQEAQKKIEASKEGFRYTDDDDDDDQSILVQKLRELIIRFEKLLAKYLDPDIPKGRADRKKWEREETRFRAYGYKDFINSIDLKVEALCNFEGYGKEQFCLDGNPNWFKQKISEALNGNFYSAQEVVNSVMQIVKEEEYAVPKRRIVAKLK